MIKNQNSNHKNDENIEANERGSHENYER